MLIFPASAEADEELHGVWVSTIANLDYPSTPTTDADRLRSEADEILNTCSELGINAVFLQARPSGDAIYPSALYPYSAYLTGSQGTPPADNSDILLYWIEQAHEKNIQLHAWINPYRVSGSSSAYLSPSNPAKQHPDWVVAYRNALYLDPGIPEAKEYVINGVREIIENYDVDGIHFDDYFYPGKDFDDSASYSIYGNGTEKADWRRSNTESLIRETGALIHRSKKDISFGVSPCGIWANKGNMENGSDTTGASAYFDMYADTLKWAKDELVDYIAPQIYWYNGFKAADYGVLTGWWSEQLSGNDTKLYIGLGDYRLDEDIDSQSPWYDGNEIKKQMIMNKENERIDGEIHFRYKSITNNPPLYEKIKAEYTSEAPANQSNVPEECIYIYYDKFANPIYTKKDLQRFDISRCRGFAPENADYAKGIYFSASGKVRQEHISIK